MRYRIFDHVLSMSDYNPLVHNILDAKIPFGFYPYVNIQNELSHDYSFQFVHVTYFDYTIQNENSFKLIAPILNFLNPSAIRRIKINLNPRAPSNLTGNMHTDFSDQSNFLTAIYYINDNNGGTLFEKDNLFVPSVANRLLVFEGNNNHSGVSCTDQFVRMVINIGYYATDDSIFTAPFYPSLKKSLNDLPLPHHP